MQNNMSPFDFKKSIKRGLIYLLCAIPAMLVVSVVFTIINTPYWLTLLTTVVAGGIAVFICYVIGNKLDEKRKEKMKEDKSYDPFKD